MAYGATLKVTCLAVVILMSVSAREGEAAESCNQVVSYLMPCLSYLTRAGTLTGECCSGVNAVYKLAQTPTDRRNVCQCLKSVAGGVSYSPDILSLAAGLPKKCGVNIPYKISPTTDCATVK